MKTREVILYKTFGLLLKKGYQGVSVSDIQQETGMARGLLYHYFSDLEQLFAEVTEQYMQRWLKVNREEKREMRVGEVIVYVVERMEGIGRCLSEEWGEQISFADVVLLFREAVRQHPGLKENYGSCRADWLGVWRTALFNSFCAGELRSGLNMASVAWNFVCIIDSVLLNSAEDIQTNDTIYQMEKGLKDFFEIIKR